MSTRVTACRTPASAEPSRSGIDYRCSSCRRGTARTPPARPTIPNRRSSWETARACTARRRRPPARRRVSSPGARSTWPDASPIADPTRFGHAAVRHLERPGAHPQRDDCAVVDLVASGAKEHVGPRSSAQPEPVSFGRIRAIVHEVRRNRRRAAKRPPRAFGIGADRQIVEQRQLDRQQPQRTGFGVLAGIGRGVERIEDQLRGEQRANRQRGEYRARRCGAAASGTRKSG